MLNVDPSDAKYRHAAYAHLTQLLGGRSTLEREAMAIPYYVGEERLTLVDPQRGIHRPRAMKHLLSITTVVPARGRKIWYADQTKVHQNIYEAEEGVRYSFMGDDPNAQQNQSLREAAELRLPIIYFLGVKPGLYQPLYPVFLTDWDPGALDVRLVFGLHTDTSAENYFPERHEDRRYTMRLVKQRLHQAQFREAVIDAYSSRCAITGLCEIRLLDAAHIVPDSEKLGMPVVPNGIPLSKLHHAAFDANLIGIDADGLVHISEHLLSARDGPLLEHGLKAMDGRRIILPERLEDRPDRELLDLRFQAFKSAV